MAKIKTIFINIFFLIFLLTVKPANATNITVICPNDSSTSSSGLSCSLSSTEPLFSYQNIYPGFITNPSHLVTVENLDTNNPCFLKATSSKISGSDLLLDGSHRLNLSITDSGPLNYSGPLIFSNLFLGQIDQASTKTFSWTVSLPQDTPNDYQGLNTAFQIDLNFVCADNPAWQPAVINPTSGVYLSEFMPQTPEGDEWVEIYNNNSFPVSLSNWMIKDDPTNKNLPKVFDASIPAKSFFVINFASGYLNNTGTDYVVLISDIGTTIESVSYSGSSTTKSWSKQTDSLWCQTTPSKGLANNPCPGVATASTSQGTVLAQSTSTTSTCSHAKPDTPTGLSITSASNSANLSWDPVSPPISSYLIAYGPTTDNILYGNPNIGLQTSYTVSGLTPSAQYCFYVRAQNGCMPGDASETVCINTGSSIPIVETEPPVGFQPQVLGQIDSQDKTPNQTSQNIASVLAATDTSRNSISKIFFYLPIFLVSLFLIKTLRQKFYSNQ